MSIASIVPFKIERELPHLLSPVEDIPAEDISITTLVTIDAAFFPDIMDTILSELARDHVAAIKLQTVCREWHKVISASVFKHLRIVSNRYSQAEDGYYQIQTRGSAPDCRLFLAGRQFSSGLAPHALCCVLKHTRVLDIVGWIPPRLRHIIHSHSSLDVFRWHQREVQPINATTWVLCAPHPEWTRSMNDMYRERTNSMNRVFSNNRSLWFGPEAPTDIWMAPPLDAPPPGCQVMVVDSWFVTELVLEQLAFVPCRSIVMLRDFNVDQLRRFPKGINKVQGWNSALSFIATRINDAVRECPEWLQAMNVAFTVVLDHHGTLKRTVLQALTDNIRQQCPADFDWMLVSREEYISKVGEEVSGHHTSFATE